MASGSTAMSSRARAETTTANVASSLYGSGFTAPDVAWHGAGAGERSRRTHDGLMPLDEVSRDPTR